MSHGKENLSNMNDINIRGGLTRFKQALAKGKVKIGFAGGSITTAKTLSNWPTYVRGWFVDSFKDVRLTVVNSAIGATGSLCALSLAKKEFIDTSCDLVFVEFAVNDNGADRDERMRTREGLIRKLLSANIDVANRQLEMFLSISRMMKRRYAEIRAGMADMPEGVVKRMKTHPIDGEIVGFKIKSINDYVGVQKTVVRALSDEGFFSDENNIVTNVDSGMIVEITKDGIKETLGPGSRFQTLPRKLKELKLATIRELPSLIEGAKLELDNKLNYHNDNSKLKYAYLSNEVVDDDGNEYTITITVRKSFQKNMFWIHKIFAKEKEQGLSSSRNLSSYQEYNKTLALDDIIARDDPGVKTKSQKAPDSAEVERLKAQVAKRDGRISQQSEVIDKLKTVVERGGAGTVPYLCVK